MLKYILNPYHYNRPNYEVFQRITPTNIVNPSTSTNTPEAGTTVVMSQDASTLVITAPLETIFNSTTNKNHPSTGVVYVFKKNSTGGYQYAQMFHPELDGLQTSDARFGAYQSPYGVALSRDGNVLVVGCPRRAVLNTNTSTYHQHGAVYIYTKQSNGDFTFKTRIDFPLVTSTPTDKIAGFGQAVSVSDNGDVIVIAAPSDNYNATTNAYIGALYVFKLQNDTYSNYERIVPGVSSMPNTYPTVNYFGRSGVSINGDGTAIAVGVETYRNSSLQSNYGAVYIFNQQTNGTYQSTPTVLTTPVSNTTTNNNFGSFVKFSKDGSLLLVAATGEKNTTSDSSTLYETGNMHIFQKQANGAYILKQTLTPDTLYASGLWCSSIEITSDNKKIVVGWMNGKLTNTASVVGTSYIFELNENDRYEMTSKYAYNRGAGGGYGCSVTIDSTGDAFVVGARSALSRKGEIIIYK